MLRRVHFGEGKYQEMVFFPNENFAPGGKRTGRCGVQQANDPNERGRGSSRRNHVEGRSTEMEHFLGCVATTAVAGEVVNVAGASGIAVGGYDPVAFFTDGKPTPGDPGVTSTYKGATYLFASKAHKTQFEGHPEKYVPQFGGFCAYGAALGGLFPVDINTWQVRNGKLYLNLNPAISAEFNKDPAGFIAKAEENWPGLVKKYGN
jgi:YHS domain-containing protein